MYGPVATWKLPYSLGFLASNFLAYSGGTGALIGSTRAPITIAAFASVRWKTIVYLSGVVIPEMGPPLAVGAPSIALK